MLHLFKKTYLDIDSYVDSNIDRIVLSKEKGTEFYKLLEDFFKGKLIAYGQDLNDVIGEGKIFNDFISMLNVCYEHNTKTNRKVVIYCDRSTFMLLSSMWFKTILKMPQNSSVFNILKSYFNKQIYISNIMYERPNNNDDYETFNLNEADFYQTFDTVQLKNTDVDDFYNKVKGSLSLEYYIASYYYDNSFKDELKNTAKLMILRLMGYVVKDAWKIISTNIANKKFREKMLVSKEYNNSNYIDALNDIRFNSLKSFGANLSNTDDWSSVHVLPDVSYLSDAQVEEIKNQIVKCYALAVNGLDNDDFNSFGSYLKKNLNLYFDVLKSRNFSDQTFEEIVSPLNLSEGLEKFWSSVDRRNINFFLIDQFIEIKIASQQSLLSGYCLK